MSSFGIFSPSVCLPFQWDCRWPWPAPLLPPWCSCWVSLHLHEACKTQTQACGQLEKVKNSKTSGGKPEILSDRGERGRRSQSIHFLTGGLKCRKTEQISDQVIGQVWNCNTEQTGRLQKQYKIKEWRVEGTKELLPHPEGIKTSHAHSTSDKSA